MVMNSPNGSASRLRRISQAALSLWKREKGGGGGGGDYLMQLGILDPHWVLIHGIHVTELDIEHMARVGCSFVYTPTSESIRGGGISPFANARLLATCAC